MKKKSKNENEKQDYLWRMWNENKGGMIKIHKKGKKE